ncbi:MAG: hypothetical protein AUK07_01520 [Parcubacteria group bacterium CG2_30_36_21]|nr:MAG: hypothetical protein AUK07_01520 [Parcubacteria group bacterium CG2_30_36_21]
MTIIWHGQSFFELITKDKDGKELKIVLDPFDEGLGLKVPKTEARILIISHQHSDHNNEKAISAPASGSPPFLGDEPSIHLHSTLKGFAGDESSIHLHSTLKGFAGDESSIHLHSTLNGFVIEEPGEYEINGVYVQGIPALGEVIIYLIETEDMKICHLGDFGQKELSPEQLDQLGDIDILMVPIGGVGTIDAKGASKIISQIEPKLVIPMRYQIPEQQRRVEMKRQLHRPPELKLKLDHPSDSEGGRRSKKQVSSPVSPSARQTKFFDPLEQFLKEMGSPAIEPQKKLKIKSSDLPKEKIQIIVLEPS